MSRHNSSSRTIQNLTLAGLLVALATVAIYAQSCFGTLRGTVVDPNGGAIAGAKVTLINEGTAEQRAALEGLGAVDRIPQVAHRGLHLKGVADPGGVADDFDGLVGEIDRHEVGGFVEEGFFEGGFVLDIAVGVTVGEFIEDEGIEGGFCGIDEGFAEGFDGGAARATSPCIVPVPFSDPNPSRRIDKFTGPSRWRLMTWIRMLLPSRDASASITAPAETTSFAPGT